ncbi:hypothetical protein [Azoarcus sp. DN11]|uniref:hypothetical protein n=1 Tax=Azoarcus sp. DN11 TaxID=356837 RepID=UPI000FE1F388|nr:hypothetical protein [Azoarcus sp. DN11]
MAAPFLMSGNADEGAGQFPCRAQHLVTPSGPSAETLSSGMDASGGGHHHKPVNIANVILIALKPARAEAGALGAVADIA